MSQLAWEAWDAFERQEELRLVREAAETKPRKVSLRGRRILVENHQRSRSDRLGSRHDGKVGEDYRQTVLTGLVTESALSEFGETPIEVPKTKLGKGMGVIALKVAEITETGLVRLWTGKPKAVTEPPEAFSI